MKYETLWDKFLATIFDIREMFLEYPHSKNQTYPKHLIYNLGYVVLVLVSSILLMIHAVVPFLFKDMPSAVLRDVMDKLKGS